MIHIKRWWKNLCIFHDWGKWSQYQEHGKMYVGRLSPKALQGIPLDYVKDRQRRVCLRCGKEQNVLVRGADE